MYNICATLGICDPCCSFISIPIHIRKAFPTGKPERTLVVEELSSLVLLLLICGAARGSWIAYLSPRFYSLNRLKPSQRIRKEGSL